MKIVALEPLGVKNEKFEAFQKRFAEKGHDFSWYSDRQEDESVLIERAMAADVIILSNIPLTDNFLEHCPDLKMISVAFTGYDHIPMDSCRKKNILVSNAAGFSTHAVSELCLAMIISLYRRIQPLSQVTVNGGTREGFLGNEVYGKTIGIIGTGMIGIQTGRLLKAMGANILAWSRTQKQEAIEAGFTYVKLDELLVQSDIISLHVPLNKDTESLIGVRELALMQPHCILINTARGKVVDNEALADALKSGKLRGAAVDIYEMEPPLPPDYPLLDAPNTLLLPHIAYASEEALDLRAEIVIENVFAWMNAKPLRVVS